MISFEKHCIHKLYIVVKHLNPCLLNTLVKKQVLRGSFGEILLIQIQLFPQTSFEAELGSFNFKNEVSAHGLGLVVQLS